MDKKIKDVLTVSTLIETAKIPISQDGVSAQTATVKLIIDLAGDTYATKTDVEKTEKAVASSLIDLDNRILFSDTDDSTDYDDLFT